MIIERLVEVTVMHCLHGLCQPLYYYSSSSSSSSSSPSGPLWSLEMHLAAAAVAATANSAMTTFKNLALTKEKR